MFAQVVTTFQALDASAWYVPRVLTGIIFVLLQWRFWSFTVKPALNPKHPKEIPYWIPWLGHAPAFVSDGQNLLRRGRLYFGNTREPFFITLGGQRLYVLTAPDDIALAYKDTDVFTFDKAVADLTHHFGVSKASCEAVYKKPTSKEDDPATKAGFDNPGLKSIAHLNNDYLKKQLHPGEQFNQMAARFAKLLHEWTSPSHLKGDSIVLASSADGKEKTVSFYHWSQEVLLQVASRAIFGNELLTCGDNLFKNFLTFDDENWRLWYQVPGSTNVKDAKDRVVEIFNQYISIPRENRPHMAPVIDYYERTKRANGIPPKEIATVISMLYFVINTNTYKLSFWIMTYLLHEPTLLKDVAAEIKLSFSPATKEADFQYLVNNCPLLNAVFDETLRLCSANASIRTTTKPIEVNGKMIPANAQILCPFRELHWNTDVWGEDPSKWDPTRFLKQKTLSRSTSYRPFGGGLSYCPGRFIARAEALLFVALVLERFDISLKDGQAFPRYDTKPNPALMAPVKGDDLLVIVRERA